MRASRLLSILILLQTRGRLSADELSREFEVSVRTIYRDIDELSAAGVPVYAERGRAGGFQLHDGYRTRLTGLTLLEAEALLLAGIGGAAADLGLGEEAASARLKLLASLPADAGRSAMRVASRFHLDAAGWYARVEPLDLLLLLASAVWSERSVRIQYHSWKARVTRVVDPLGLVLKAGVWYVAAQVRRDLRIYRVSNIRSLEVLDASFVRPSRFDLARHWAAHVSAFEADLMGQRAKIRVSAAGMALMRDVMPAAAQAIDRAQAARASDAAANKWMHVEIPVEAIEQSARQMLRLGAEVEVLEPPALRDAVQREARRVAALYLSDETNPASPRSGRRLPARRSASRR